MILQQKRKHQACRCCHKSQRLPVFRLIENDFAQEKCNQKPHRPVSCYEKRRQFLHESRFCQLMGQEKNAELQSGVEQREQHIGNQESSHPSEVKITPCTLILFRPQCRAYSAPDKENGNMVAAQNLIQIIGPSWEVLCHMCHYDREDTNSFHPIRPCHSFSGSTQNQTPLLPFFSYQAHACPLCLCSDSIISTWSFSSASCYFPLSSEHLPASERRFGHTRMITQRKEMRNGHAVMIRSAFICIYSFPGCLPAQAVSASRSFSARLMCFRCHSRLNASCFSRYSSA